MSVPLAVALLALLVALFSLVALVAVYARVRALEAGRALLAGGGVSGYAPLVGRPAPVAVHPRPGQRAAVVAVLDADCGICREVWAAIGAVAGREARTRFVGLAPPGAADLPAAGPAELLTDPGARADLYEGYAPTVLGVDAAGVVLHRSFVYPDTDLEVLLMDLSEGREASRA